MQQWQFSSFLPTKGRGSCAAALRKSRSLHYLTSIMATVLVMSVIVGEMTSHLLVLFDSYLNDMVGASGFGLWGLPNIASGTSCVYSTETVKVMSAASLPILFPIRSLVKSMSSKLRFQTISYEYRLLDLADGSASNYALAYVALQHLFEIPWTYGRVRRMPMVRSLRDVCCSFKEPCLLFPGASFTVLMKE